MLAGQYARVLPSTLTILLAFAGCRDGFDAEQKRDADPGFGGIDAAIDAPEVPPQPMKIDQGATQWVVEAPGRFSLTFIEADAWQPMRWEDASRPGLDLSASGADENVSPIMTTLVACNMGTCVAPQTMENATLSVDGLTASVATIRLEWEWTFEAQPFVGVATYTIGVDGALDTEIALTNNGSVDQEFSLELGDAHVNESLPWRISESLNMDFFDFRLPATDELPAIAFEVEVVPPMGEIINGDEPHNRYFVRQVTVAAGATETARTAARIWLAP